MAKKVVGKIKLQIEAGKANPSPPVGPALGQHGVNIMDFCKQSFSFVKAHDIVIYLVVKACFELESWNVERVGQTSYVENKVCIFGIAIFKAERDNVDDNTRFFLEEILAQSLDRKSVV